MQNRPYVKHRAGKLNPKLRGQMRKYVLR